MYCKPEKILIIKPSALGDIVMAMPAVCALAKSFPGAKISWFVRPEYSALLQCCDYVDELIIFDRKKLGKWWCNYEAFRELLGLIKQLRRERFDIVFDFQGRFRSAIFAFFSGCKRRIGTRATQEITAPFYTKRISPPEESNHSIDYYLKMVCTEGAVLEKPEFNLIPSAQALAEVKKLLSVHNANSENYFVFVPASAVESKCWPVENFAILADKLVSRYGCDIITTGIKSEEPISEKLQALSKSKVINLAGLTNLKQLIALLSGAKMVVSNDTGPAHIASALASGLVIIFGQTNPSRVSPYSRPDAFVAIDAQSRGSAVESRDADHDIRNVTVESVFEKICSQLDNAN